MAKRRIKFIWGAADEIPGQWHLGLWGAYERDPGSRIQGLAVSWRGLLRWCVGCAIAIYVGGAAALFFWFTQRPYNQVTFTDTLLLPVRWSQVRELRGRMLIEEGLADFRGRRWSEANMKLRVGLTRSPHDLKARLALAQFYLLANRRPSALTLLTEDLGNGYPGRSYMTTLFTLAAQGEDYDVIVSACDRFIGTNATERPWLTGQKMQALLGAGRPAEALQLAEAEGDRGGAMIDEGRVIALLDLKRSGEALDFLRGWRQRSSAAEPQVLRLEVRAYREAGRLAEMHEALERFRQLAPADPRTYVYGLVQTSLAGQSREAEDVLDDYFLRFAGTAQNLVLAANALSEAKAATLVQRCVDQAALHGFPAKPFKSALLQVQLAVADWPGANRTLVEVKALAKRPEPAELFALNWMERLLAVASRPDEEPQAGLLEFLQQRPLPMRVYRETSELLAAAGRFAAARSVLDLAERTYPASRTLAVLRARVDLAMRPAPVAVSVSAVAAADVPKEKEFFQELQAAENEHRWADAAQAIRKIRVAKPAWLGSREADVFDWQMRVAIQTGDTLELLAAAKQYLDGSRDRASRVVALARGLGTSGNKDDAELLLREVLRKNPDFPPVLRLRKEWAPKPKPAAKPKSEPSVKGV